MCTRPSFAPAVSIIVAGSPVERRHCPALLLFTADTCKASSWAGTGSSPRAWSAASIIPIFPHPPSVSRLSLTWHASQTATSGSAVQNETLSLISWDSTFPLLSLPEKIPLEISTAVDVLLPRSPRRLSSLSWFSPLDPADYHRGNCHCQRSSPRTFLPTSQALSLEEATRRPGRRRRGTGMWPQGAASIYSGRVLTTRGRIRQCGAKRVRIYSPLSETAFAGVRVPRPRRCEQNTHTRPEQADWYRRVCAARLTYWPNIIAMAIRWCTHTHTHTSNQKLGRKCSHERRFKINPETRAPAPPFSRSGRRQVTAMVASADRGRRWSRDSRTRPL